MPLKVFISYSHKNEKDKDDFIKHLAPLESKQDIEIWHDRKMLPGEAFEERIKSKINQSDIICLMISADYLNSTSCKQEKELAFDIKKKKYIDVIPIIISDCGWKDDSDICSVLAPNDGKPIYDYDSKDKAWYCIYEELKKVIENAKSINELELSDNHELFLNDADLLANAHADKGTIFLEDIFIYPNLTKMDEIKDVKKNIDAEDFIEEFYENKKILLVGENQSGKTTLCKKIYSKLKENGFVPIYLKEAKFEGKIKNIIKNVLEKQYKNSINFDYENNIARMVLIIDDFHMLSNKEILIRKTSLFWNQIIVVDDVFTFNFRDETLTKQYSRYEIKPYGPKKRDLLIKKWIGMNKEYDNSKDNYKLIDEKTELVNNLFKKTMGKGGLQAYPFFVLSSLNIFETVNNKLDTEITSQGHCYQALIYLYLRKEKVENKDIDAYINFLSELAIYLFDKNVKELTQKNFDNFLEEYKKNYNFYIEDDALIKLYNSKIFLKNNLGNYIFAYDYLYYYFVAKYLSEHINNRFSLIKDMIANLHKNENAYILIFLLHHTKEDEIMEELLKAAKSIFSLVKKTTTLKKEELKFVDEKIKDIVAEAILPENLNPEKEREKRLDIQQDAEDLDIEDELTDNNSNDFVTEFRKGIKIVEVIGQIAKNRAGSLKRQKIKDILTDGININLRIITILLNVMAKQEERKQIIDFISTKLRLYMRHKNKKIENIDIQQLKKYATIIFWHLPFVSTYDAVKKIIHSLGSDKLLDVISELYDENKTPANCLLKHGIFMWYGKNLQLDNIKRELEEKDFSETAKRVMYYLIIEHCSMHKISQKERQRVEQFLNKKPNSLMQAKYEPKK
jgi:hypothetical protein